jgi:hypothetical protein
MRPLIGDPKECARSNYWNINFCLWGLHYDVPHRNLLDRFLMYTAAINRDLRRRLLRKYNEPFPKKIQQKFSKMISDQLFIFKFNKKRYKKN